MDHFYRFVRPLQFDERRTTVQTLPHGGICLRFDEAEEGMLTFAHARCHPNELFSRTVARRIADERAMQHKSIVAPFPKVPLTMNANHLALSVAEISDHYDPDADLGANFWLTYYKLELHELSTALKQVLYHNDQIMKRAGVWTAGLEAAKFKEQYENLDKDR